VGAQERDVNLRDDLVLVVAGVADDGRPVGIPRQVAAVDLEMLAVRLVKRGTGSPAVAVHAVEIQALVPIVRDRGGVERQWSDERRASSRRWTSQK
jgi:hypothetical protein